MQGLVKKEIRVILLEDDPYSLDLITMLLARDWRTAVVAETTNEAQLFRALPSVQGLADILLLDTEVPEDPDMPRRVVQKLEQKESRLKVLLTCTQANASILQLAIQVGLSGYVDKHDLQYALGAAIGKVWQGATVFTPGVVRLAFEQRINLPANSVQVSDTTGLANLSPKERQIARLAIIFNLTLADIGDELGMRPDEVGKTISRIYSKLGLKDILLDETPLEDFFMHESVLQRFRTAREHVRYKRNTTNEANDARLFKVPGMSTFAYHLLTVPELRALS